MNALVFPKRKGGNGLTPSLALRVGVAGVRGQHKMEPNPPRARRVKGGACRRAAEASTRKFFLLVFSRFGSSGIVRIEFRAAHWRSRTVTPCADVVRSVCSTL